MNNAPMPEVERIRLIQDQIDRIRPMVVPGCDPYSHGVFNGMATSLAVLTQTPSQAIEFDEQEPDTLEMD